MAQPPQPPDNPDIPDLTLQSWDGIKNVISAERLGPKDLAAAVNIDLDDAGQPHRRRGVTQVATGDFSSLFTSNEGIVYGVKNTQMGIIHPDWSFLSISSGYTDDPISYVQIGNNIYFSSRSVSGVIDQAAQKVNPWGSDPDLWLSPVVNPTATLPAIRGQLLGRPPLATYLAYLNGRIYLAHGNVVWATELFLYNYVDRTKNFWNFEATITMIGAVTDGLYIGTTEGVWFVSGPFAEAKRVRVMDSGVLPGSMVYVPSELANPPQIGLDVDTPVKVAIMFMTHAGICGGQDSGVCYNFTESKVVFPTAFASTAMFRQQDGMHQYVVVNDSGGTPAANSRIGDYVSATIVRRGDWGNLGGILGFHDSFTPTWR